MRRHLPLLATVALGATLAACGGGSDEESNSTIESTVPDAAPDTAPDTVSETTEPTETSATPTTVPATSAPESTSPESTAPTSVPATSAPTTMPATTAPSTVITATTTSPGPAAETPSTFFATTDLGLVEVEVASGSVVNTVDDFFSGDGLFRGYIRLTPDRGTIYFSEGYEDSWYGCETSVGSLGSIDVESGTIESLGRGTQLETSPDASSLIYVDSETCLPDPEQPDLWVLTPYDRAVVRDVASGAEVVYASDTPPDAYDAPTSVRWADMHDDGSVFVQLGSGDVHRIPDGETGTVQDFPVAFNTDAVPWELVGDQLIATIFGAEGSSDLVSIDVNSGAVTPLASAEVYMAVGVGNEGQLLAVADGEITVEPGVDLTTVDFPIDGYYYDLDW